MKKFLKAWGSTWGVKFLSGKSIFVLWYNETAMHAVTESLFVGNLDDAKNPPHFITGLLFVAEEQDLMPPPSVIFSRVPMKEFAEADPGELKRAVEWMELHAPSNRLLVCCRAGMGRSVSVVIAYLCSVQGMDFDQALMLLRARRPGATPLPRLQETISSLQKLRKTADGEESPPFSGQVDAGFSRVKAS